MFEAGAFSPKLEFESSAPVDTSKTAVGVFGGAAFCPKLSDKLTLLAQRRSWRRRGFHWSATLGFEYRFKPWGGAAFGYRALGIDTGCRRGAEQCRLRHDALRPVLLADAALEAEVGPLQEGDRR
jgi:hypothetical protein